MSKNPLIIVLLSLFTFSALAQKDGVSIGKPAPEESAILDVHSPTGTKGMLIPRIPDRNLIENEVEGLIIYHEASQAFEYYDGDDWIQLIPTPAKFPIDMDNNKIVGLADGEESDDAVNKGQLDAGLARFDANNLDRDGSEAMTGNLNMGSQQIKNVANATQTNDAVNKGQLDNVERRIPQVGYNISNRRASYPPLPINAQFFTDTGSDYLIQSRRIRNFDSRIRDYVCVAHFSMMGSGEGEDIGVSLSKNGNIFASWRQMIRPGSRNGEDQYVIIGEFSLDPNETADIRNELRLFDDDIFVSPRGMFIISQ